MGEWRDNVRKEAMCMSRIVESIYVCLVCSMITHTTRNAPKTYFSNALYKKTDEGGQL